MIKNLKRYFKIWCLMTKNSFMIALVSRFGAMFFLVGKIIRFLLFLFFLVTVLKRTNFLAGYTFPQVVFFFLVFNLIDISAQLFLREVYRFRPLVVSGDFDLILTKPFSPLFRVLFGGADFLDLLTLIPLIVFIFWYAKVLGILRMINLILFLILYLNGFLIAVSFHILVLSLGILTTEVDHTIMIYRDLTQMGKVPIDIYQEPIRSFLTFIVPIAIMITFPAKAFLGLLSFRGAIYSLLIGMFFLFLSLKIWKYSLSKYSSASS